MYDKKEAKEEMMISIMQELMSKNEELMEKINQMKKENKENNKQLRKMTQENEIMKTEIKTLKHKVEILDKSIKKKNLIIMEIKTNTNDDKAMETFLAKEKQVEVKPINGQKIEENACVIT